MDGSSTLYTSGQIMRVRLERNDDGATRVVFEYGRKGCKEIIRSDFKIAVALRYQTFQHSCPYSSGLDTVRRRHSGRQP